MEKLEKTTHRLVNKEVLAGLLLALLSVAVVAFFQNGETNTLPIWVTLFTLTLPGILLVFHGFHRIDKER